MTKRKPFYWAAVATLCAAITVLSLSPATGQSLWHGENIRGYISLAQAEALLTSLNGAAFSFLGAFFRYTNNPNRDTGVLHYEHGKTWDGYTLLSSVGGDNVTPGLPPAEDIYGAVLIDMEGRHVKSWPLVAFPAKMLPDGSVMGGQGGGFAAGIGVQNLARMDWNDNVVWKWTPNHGDTWEFPAGVVNTSGCHHDYQFPGSPVGYYHPGMRYRPHGKTLILSSYMTDESETGHISGAFRLYDDVIYELGPHGNVVFRWFAHEHFDQMGLSEDAKIRLRTAPVIGAIGSDWQHFNNVNYLGPNKWYHRYHDLRFHPDNILWDARSSNIMAIIARWDHPKGKWRSGDIVWKVGPDYSVGSPGYELGQIIGMHHAHMIPPGLPGAGNIMVFDNGGLAGLGAPLRGLFEILDADGKLNIGNITPFGTFRDYSRVIEFNPRTFDVVWEYLQPHQLRDDAVDAPYEPDKPRKLFAPAVSSAQRLPNRNTLICDGTNGRVIEVTRKGEIVWEYYSEYGWGATGPGLVNGQAVYRAYRVPKWWVDPHL